MSENTLLGIAAIGAVAVGGLIAWRALDPNRQRVAYAPAQPVVPPSSQPVQSYPTPPIPSPTPTPTPTPTITKGQFCAELKAKLQKLQDAADDVRKKMNDLVAKGSAADQNCWSYAKREACGLFDICSPALWGNYNACMDYVKGQGPRPGNLFNYDDSRAVDRAAQEYASLKTELETYQAQIEGVKKQLQQLAVEGVFC